MYQVITIDNASGNYAVWGAFALPENDKPSIEKFKSFLKYLERSTKPEAFRNFYVLNTETRKAYALPDCFDYILDKLDKALSA